jgi:predicted phosphodiesterase
LIGALGDIHGAFDAARAIVGRHPEVAFWLCVGDIADEAGRYESVGAPIYWIHGNNDNFDGIAAGGLPDGLHHIANGTAIEIPPEGGRDLPPEGGRDLPPEGGRDLPPEGGNYTENVPVASAFRRNRSTPLRVAGLGGTFAPSWYETPAADLPHPKKGSARATELADKRRHFVADEVQACKALQGVDIFLTHEAAKPFRAFPGGRGPDAGKAQINEILASMRPRLHLFGHHHRLSEQVVEGVRSIGLDLVSRSYLLVEAASLATHTLKY